MSLAVSRMLPLQPVLALFFLVVLLVVADAPLTSWSPSNSPFTRLAEDQTTLNATSHSGLVGVVPVVLLSLPICL